MAYLLDTNICIFYLRGNPQVQKKLREVGRTECAISEITIFELRYGAENSLDPKEGHTRIDKFLRGLQVFGIRPTDHRYAREKTRLRKLGIPLHDELDLLIGVAAVEYNRILVTDNTKHFSRIERVQLENWLVRS